MKKVLLIMTAICFIVGPAFAGTKLQPVTQTQTTVTVTGTAADIVTALSSGQDIFIQNNDATGIVYLNFSGTATVSATMVRLNPGESISAGNTTNAVSAIGSIASNANVAVLVGK